MMPAVIKDKVQLWRYLGAYTTLNNEINYDFLLDDRKPQKEEQDLALKNILQASMDFFFYTKPNTIVKVGNKEYKMDLERYVNRFEKKLKRLINDKRSYLRRYNNANGKPWNTAPALSTIPLWYDIDFLQGLQTLFKNNEKWVSNEDDTVRTLKWRIWFAKDLDMQISFLSLYESADFHPSEVK